MYFARMRADNYTWPQFWLHADGAGVRVGLNHDPGGAEGRDLPANTAWSLGRFSTAKIATSDLIWLCSSSASSPEIYYAFPGGKPDSPTNLGTIPAC